jgi:hypothetical protein
MKMIYFERVAMEKTPPPHRTQTHPTPHPPPTGGISRDPHEAKLAERTFLIAHSDFIISHSCEQRDFVPLKIDW